MPGFEYPRSPLTMDYAPEDQVNQPGDVLRSSGGSYYLIYDVRKVKSRKHPNRYRLGVVRIAETHPLFDRNPAIFDIDYVRGS